MIGAFAGILWRLICPRRGEVGLRFKQQKPTRSDQLRKTASGNSEELT